MIDFSKFKATLHSWDKTELVMMYYVFYLLLWQAALHRVPTTSSATISI